MSKRQDRRVKRRHLRALPVPQTDPVAPAVGIVIVSFQMPMPTGAECHYCHKREATTRDHIVPKAMRGTDAWWNLVPSCLACNSAKGDKPPTCGCAFCSRAVFLFELGHMRPVKSPRTPYIEKKPAQKKKRQRSFKERMLTSMDREERAYYQELFKVHAPPLNPPHWEQKKESFDGSV